MSLQGLLVAANFGYIDFVSFKHRCCSVSCSNRYSDNYLSLLFHAPDEKSQTYSKHSARHSRLLNSRETNHVLASSGCWSWSDLVCVFEFELEGRPAGTDVLRKHNVTCWRRVSGVPWSVQVYCLMDDTVPRAPLQLGQWESRHPATSSTIHIVPVLLQNGSSLNFCFGVCEFDNFLGRCVFFLHASLSCDPVCISNSNLTY